MFPSVTVSLLCLLQAVSKIHVPIYPYLISKGDEIVRLCNRRSNETVTLKKDVTKYKNMRKCIIEFLRKFEYRGIKIARVNSILITKSIDFTVIIFYFVRCYGSVVMLTS